MLMQHTIEVITSTTARKMKKTVAVLSPKIENHYMFFIFAAVGACLRSVLKSSYFQSNLRNEWSNNMSLLYVRTKQFYPKKRLQIKHRAMLFYIENLRSEIRRQLTLVCNFVKVWNARMFMVWSFPDFLLNLRFINFV